MVFPPYSLVAQALKKGICVRHYSGKLYEIVGVSRSSDEYDSCLELVTYRTPDDKKNQWTATIGRFTDFAITADGHRVPRFTIQIGDEPAIPVARLYEYQ
jgi:hypothetical protein